jgi:cation:H+ antiporter
MADAMLWFVAGLVLLALGGDSIVKGAAGLAQRLGASPFIAGLLLVAFGTSLPELAVNARAVWTGHQALALGNAVGSNIANIGLTLGAAALAAPLVLRSRAVGPLLVWLLAMTAVTIGFGFDGVLSRSEGLLLLAGFVVMLAFLLLRGKREPVELQADIARFAETRPGLGLNLSRVAIAVVAMYFGAKWLVQSAPIVGIGLGMGPLVTGLLPVAIGTALPEMAAAVVAARRGQGDMVAGHVLGSSLFNLLVVLGGMAAFRPLPLPASFVQFELPAAFALALVLFPMARSELRISRREGAVLLLAFAAWLAWELLHLAV